MTESQGQAQVQLDAIHGHYRRRIAFLENEALSLASTVREIAAQSEGQGRMIEALQKRVEDADIALARAMNPEHQNLEAIDNHG